ncbi:hypothetical protein XELAEV_18003653mg [Xenopus laevis]|uniref:Uncharacterized protein n=1 Tax=Xenopus laevis TaxID=8355 RepID=A0A974GY48_XENLA|nr:hypothetical protein XELAEV_18003653mg [Xenopus laevis]
MSGFEFGYLLFIQAGQLLYSDVEYVGTIYVNNNFLSWFESSETWKKLLIIKPRNVQIPVTYSIVPGLT